MLDGVQFPWLISLLDKGQRVQPGGGVRVDRNVRKTPLDNSLPHVIIITYITYRTYHT